MSLTRQTTIPVKTGVSIEFPDLPSAPRMTIAADESALGQYNQQLSNWYFSLRTALLDKFIALQAQANSLQQQITALKK